MAPKWTPKAAVSEADFKKIEKIEKYASTAQARTDCMWALAVKRPRRLKTPPQNQTDSRNLFFYGKSEQIRKLTPERSPNGRGYFVLTSLGRPFAHNWCPSPFLKTKNGPKVVTECPQSSKWVQKVTPKDPKRSKSYFKSAFVGGPGLADCAERFQ